MKRILTGAVAMFALAAASSAGAATFDLTYAFGVGGLSATIEGDLQADMNTVIVTGISDVNINLVDESFSVVSSISTLLGAGVPGGTPLLSLDGTGIDFAACEDPACSGGFSFDNGPLVTGAPFAFVNTLSGTFINETFEVGRYSLTPTAAVPLPAPVALLGAAIAGLVVLRRQGAAST